MRAATLGLARQCVAAAIGRIDVARSGWLKLQKDPSSSSTARAEAHRDMLAMLAEFGWQWENVKFILEEDSKS